MHLRITGARRTGRHSIWWIVQGHFPVPHDVLRCDRWRCNEIVHVRQRDSQEERHRVIRAAADVDIAPRSYSPTPDEDLPMIVHD